MNILRVLSKMTLSSFLFFSKFGGKNRNENATRDVHLNSKEDFENY